MGRILSDTSALSGTGSNNGNVLAGNVLAGIVSATKIVPAGYMAGKIPGVVPVFAQAKEQQHGQAKNQTALLQNIPAIFEYVHEPGRESVVLS